MIKGDTGDFFNRRTVANIRRTEHAVMDCPQCLRTVYRKCDYSYAVVIPILIKPVAIVRVLVVGHISPTQTTPTIPLHMYY